MFDAKKVKGYNNLEHKDKKLFSWFCKKFYKVWEYPDDHAPVKIEKAKGYLKVALNDSDWLHVLENGDWY